MLLWTDITGTPCRQLLPASNTWLSLSVETKWAFCSHYPSSILDFFGVHLASCLVDCAVIVRDTAIGVLIGDRVECLALFNARSLNAHPVHFVQLAD